MINLLFSCAALGVAGYSEASRNYISALNLYPDQVNLAVKSVNFEAVQTDNSTYLNKIGPLLNKSIKPDTNIVHMVPPLMVSYTKPGIPNIGYTVWETTKLPENWVTICNKMSEIWVPSAWNVEVFKDSGVKVTVKKIEHTVDLNQFSQSVTVDLGLPKDKFIFYSIFQWSERKNPAATIKAFLSEFSKNDDVVLVLKTYKKDGSQLDRDSVRDEINAIKASMHISDAPQITLLHKMMSRQEILSLHRTGHCLVSPHRAEGWGCTIQEALAMGTPVIATGFGGNMEFMNSDNSYVLDYHLTPVSGMSMNIYSGRGMWAEPDVGQLMAYMRHAYEHHSDAKRKAVDNISMQERYSWSNIGKKMIDTLNGRMA